MTRTDTLLATYRGLVNSVCRPDHMTHFQITRGLASIAGEQPGLTARGRAARLFGAMADVLSDEGVLSSDDAADYVLAARDWALCYDDIPDLSALMAQL